MKTQLAYSIEVFGANALETISNFSCGHHARHWVPIADGLADSDNIGNNIIPLRLEGPHMRPNATEANLHLIRDANTARFTDIPAKETIRFTKSIIISSNLPVRLSQVIWRQDNLSTAAHHRFRDKSGNLSAGIARILN